MITLPTTDSMRHWRDAHRGQRIVIVPTMGALHAGHYSLVDRAREIAGDDGLVLATIFVNPLQFDRAADLTSYPKTLQADLEGLTRRGVDAVFTPNADDIYADDRSITVTESSLSRLLCGATRPGHFDGVCTIVLKLFLLSGASDAVFGKKDFQQLAIIRRMVRDLDVPIAIDGVETARDADGLAMSSRNTRLTTEHRAQAPVLRRALLAATDEKNTKEIVDKARSLIEQTEARIDYLDLVDAETLAAATDLSRPTVLAVAAFFGEVRLIDNIELPKRE